MENTIFNLKKREDKLKLHKLYLIENLMSFVNTKSIVTMGQIAENNIRDKEAMLNFHDILSVLAHTFFTDNGVVREEMQELVESNPALTFAVEKLQEVHCGIVCNAFGVNLTAECNKISEKLKNKELKFNNWQNEELWEKKWKEGADEKG